MKFKTFIFSTLTLSLFSLSTYAEIAVIVNPGAGVDKLSDKQVSRIFLGKMANFPGGVAAVPVDQKDEAIKDDFYQKAAGKTAAQLKSYWSKRIFSGKGTPPKELENGAAVKQWVSSNAGAIGYIDAANADGAVKVVARIK